MNIVKQSVIMEYPFSASDGMSELRRIESAARTCYKSEHKIGDEVLCQAFVRSLVKRQHLSTLEHGHATMRIVCDRGVSHEIVRHRLASYSQESTRYCNYGRQDEITVIEPPFTKEEVSIHADAFWRDAMRQCEASYLEMLKLGCSPQIARSVLPNSLKTEIVMTANFREWRHFLELRTAPAAHPQMQEIAKICGNLLNQFIPVVFEQWKF